MADFTKYNFDEIVAAITEKVKNTDGFGEAYQSSTAQMFIQTMAQITNQLHYMLERRTQENFLPTARLATSIRAIASTSGYRPRRVVSATGTVSIQLTDSAGVAVAPEGEVTLPRYTPLTFEGQDFVLDEDVVIPAGQSVPESGIKIKEGVQKSATFDPNEVGTTLYEKGYILIEDYETIEENSLDIFTSSDVYTDVTKSSDGNPPIEAISFAGPNDAVYDVRITNRGMLIYFGDGTFGKKPESEVNVNWVESSGTDVDIVTTGVSFRLETATIGDDIIKTPPNQYFYRITNDTKITNAFDIETVEHIKRTAPDYIRSANRAVTANDYAFWVRRSGIAGIVDSSVYGQNEIGVNPYTANNVYVVYLTQDSSPLTPTELTELRTYMKYYNHLTTHMVFENADIVETQINIKLKRNPNISMANAQYYDIVRSELIKTFAVDEGSLGKSIFHSDLVSHFRNYSVASGGKNVNIADWVSIDVVSLRPFSTPLEVQSIDIPITAGADGDNYVIKINGEAYTYTQQAGDTADDIASSLAALVNANGNVDATSTTNVLEVTSSVAETSFEITNEGSVNKTNIPINQTINLPPADLLNTDDEDQFVRGSIEVINGDGVVLSSDNGSGLMSAGGTIDYTNGDLVIPLLPDGDYYVRYKQDEDENLIANKRVSFKLINPKDNYNTVTETFSTIEIIS